MIHQYLIAFLGLIALGVGTPVGLNHPRATTICAREEGIYDVCDTMFSFLRCRGNRPMMAFDCAQEPDHYCLVQNDKGSCNGLRPPPMNGTIPH
ncbi:hypothetical protein F4801DRAFT_541431 [Xylaria longipes]|nr:hypothetical protein F4801DRAFT_541431 [Xylaria longipes]RYC63751.1 hypothetical protein CHU98_g2469 [Xylaria longipes]